MKILQCEINKYLFNLLSRTTSRLFFSLAKILMHQSQIPTSKFSYHSIAQDSTQNSENACNWAIYRSGGLIYNYNGTLVYMIIWKLNKWNTGACIVHTFMNVEKDETWYRSMTMSGYASVYRYICLVWLMYLGTFESLQINQFFFNYNFILQKTKGKRAPIFRLVNGRNWSEIKKKIPLIWLIHIPLLNINSYTPNILKHVQYWELTC